MPVLVTIVTLSFETSCASRLSLACRGSFALTCLKSVLSFSASLTVCAASALPLLAFALAVLALAGLALDDVDLHRIVGPLVRGPLGRARGRKALASLLVLQVGLYPRHQATEVLEAASIELGMPSERVRQALKEKRSLYRIAQDIGRARLVPIALSYELAEAFL